MKDISWKERTLLNLSVIEVKLSERDKKLYKTKKLNTIISCVWEYSRGGCHDCIIYRDTLERMILNIDRRGFHGIKEYRTLYSLVLRHLVSTHKLVQEGKYLSASAPLGMSFGVLIGYVQFDNTVIGISLGLAIGVVIGLTMDYRAKQSGVQI